MMTHRESVNDADFQIETKCELKENKYRLMVVSPKRGWLLTMALAHWIQHTGCRNDHHVTVILPITALVGSRLFGKRRQFKQ